MIASLVSIITFNLAVRKLKTAEMFYIITIYNLFSNPLKLFFYSVIYVIESTIAANRLESFLAFDNEDYDINQNDENLIRGSLEIKNGTFSYN